MAKRFPAEKRPPLNSYSGKVRAKVEELRRIADRSHGRLGSEKSLTERYIGDKKTRTKRFTEIIENQRVRTGKGLGFVFLHNCLFPALEPIGKQIGLKPRDHKRLVKLTRLGQKIAEMECEREGKGACPPEKTLRAAFEFGAWGAEAAIDAGTRNKTISKEKAREWKLLRGLFSEWQGIRAETLVKPGKIIIFEELEEWGRRATQARQIGMRGLKEVMYLTPEGRKAYDALARARIEFLNLASTEGLFGKTPSKN